MATLYIDDRASKEQTEDEGLLLTRISDVPFSIVSPTALATTTTRVYSLSIKENL